MCIVRKGACLAQPAFFFQTVHAVAATIIHCGSKNESARGISPFTDVVLGPTTYSICDAGHDGKVHH